MYLAEGNRMCTDTLIVASMPAPLRKRKSQQPLAQQTYTYDEMRSVIQSVMSERERELAEQYNRVLNEKIRGVLTYMHTHALDPYVHMHLT